MAGQVLGADGVTTLHANGQDDDTAAIQALLDGGVLVHVAG